MTTREDQSVSSTTTSCVTPRTAEPDSPHSDISLASSSKKSSENGFPRSAKSSRTFIDSSVVFFALVRGLSTSPSPSPSPAPPAAAPSAPPPPHSPSSPVSTIAAAAADDDDDERAAASPPPELSITAVAASITALALPPKPSDCSFSTPRRPPCAKSASEGRGRQLSRPSASRIERQFALLNVLKYRRSMLRIEPPRTCEETRPEGRALRRFVTAAPHSLAAPLSAAASSSSSSSGALQKMPPTCTRVVVSVLVSNAISESTRRRHTEREGGARAREGRRRAMEREGALKMRRTLTSMPQRARISAQC